MTNLCICRRTDVKDTGMKVGELVKTLVINLDLQLGKSYEIALSNSEIIQKAYRDNRHNIPSSNKIIVVVKEGDYLVGKMITIPHEYENVKRITRVLPRSRFNGINKKAYLYPHKNFIGPRMFFKPWKN